MEMGKRRGSMDMMVGFTEMNSTSTPNFLPISLKLTITQPLSIPRMHIQVD